MRKRKRKRNGMREAEWNGMECAKRKRNDYYMYIIYTLIRT
jgi:hypothetical protein